MIFADGGFGMNGKSSIQSLDRGLQILELLAKSGGMTASAIGRELGIHQSSASRLLNSLMRAGLVHKPEFHQFALDYGVLLFAGKTLESFPIVSRATAACNRILLENGYSSTTAVLYRNRVIYLALCASGSSMRLISNNNFPLHQSSPGRLLAWECGREAAIDIFNDSIAHYGGGASAEAIYDEVGASVAAHGFLFMRHAYYNHFNAAKTFDFQGRRTALAVYSETREAEPADIGPILDKAIARITGKNG